MYLKTVYKESMHYLYKSLGIDTGTLMSKQGIGKSEERLGRCFVDRKNKFRHEKQHQQTPVLYILHIYKHKSKHTKVQIKKGNYM